MTISRKRILKGFDFAIAVLLFFLTGVLSGFLNDSEWKVTVLGAFNTIKPILLYWCFSQYEFKFKQFCSFLKKFEPLFWVTFISFVLDISITSFRPMIGITAQAVDIRDGFRSIGGIYTRFTFATLVALVLYINNRYYLPRNRFRYICSGIFIFLTLKIKDIAGFIMVWASSFVKKINLGVFIVALLIPIASFELYITFFPNHYYAYFERDDDKVVRTVINNTSIEIAYDDFPLGEGFGRFASPTSIQNFSKTYTNYGIDRTWGIDPDSGHVYAYDVFWPMILGETGCLGLLFYLMILFVVFKKFVMGFVEDTRDLRYVYPTLLFIYFFICSIGKPMFSGPPHSFVLWGIAGIFESIVRAKSGGQSQMVN
jgi:hypothetical protein